MNPRPETPHLSATDLYGARFRQKRSYTNWRPHGSGDWLLIYTQAGSGRLVSPSGDCTTREGDAVLYAPGELQDYGTAPEPGEWDLLWVHFAPRPHWQLWLQWPLNECGLRLLSMEGEVREEFHAAMRRMIHLFRREIPGVRDLAFNTLENALLWANVATSTGHWLAMDARVRKAVDYLIAHLREPFALGDLARHCGVSVARLSALFKQQTGAAPRQFLERHRMEHACQLLRLSSLAIAEIAAAVGYADPFYFSNRFHRHTGKSPSRYRDGFAVESAGKIAREKEKA